MKIEGLDLYLFLWSSPLFLALDFRTLNEIDFFSLTPLEYNYKPSGLVSKDLDLSFSRIETLH